MNPRTFSINTIRIGTIAVGIFAAVFFGAALAARAQSSAAAVKSAITNLENASVKADLADDPTWYQTNLTDDWTGGDSQGTFFKKADILGMMRDKAHNSFKSESLSDLNVRLYNGDTAIATYKDTYDAMVQGAHRMTTVISTDTWVKIGNNWMLVAGHSSMAAK